ncbi:MAG: GIY-YIG nuclease family protein [Balneola sp.]
MVREKEAYVYILTNKYNKVLYTGVSSDLVNRIIQHKSKMIEGFTKKYNIDKLVYYEGPHEIYHAIQREKQIKAGSRQKKIDLINSLNPGWIDLFDGLTPDNWKAIPNQ